MKTSLFLSIVALIVFFGSVYYWNTTSTENIVFEPPYQFTKGGDPLSVVNAFFFVFFFSILFFGTLAPIAWAIEGLKFGSLLSTSRITYFDLLFIFPEFLATYAGVLFGIALNNDFEGKENFFDHWQNAIGALIAGLLVTGLLIVIPKLIVLPF